MSNDIYQSSSDEILTLRAIDPEILKDLHAVATLDQEICQEIAEQLKNLEGLNTSQTIENIVRNCLPPEKQEMVSSVRNALVSLDTATVSKLTPKIKSWVAASQARQNIFSAMILQKLDNNLNILISDLHAVELMQKADQLLRDVGNELESVKIVCDLRPVFDEPRSSVEAFVIVANMRLIYRSQDRRQRVCELALAEDELKYVRKQVDKALDKMKVLNEVRSTLAVNSTEETTE